MSEYRGYSVKYVKKLEAVYEAVQAYLENSVHEKSTPWESDLQDALASVQTRQKGWRDYKTLQDPPMSEISQPSTDIDIQYCEKCGRYEGETVPDCEGHPVIPVEQGQSES